MREIKFRAWDDLHKIMHKNAFQSHVKGFWFIGGNIIQGSIMLGSEPMIKGMQYTGLKDKNGKDVYEGDIVTKRFNNKNTYGKYVVEFSRYDFADMGVGTSTIGFWLRAIEGNDEGMLDEEKYLEVIGNIYQNPELLTNK